MVSSLVAVLVVVVTDPHSLPNDALRSVCVPAYLHTCPSIIRRVSDR